MAWSVIKHLEPRFVEAEYSGALSSAELEAVVRATLDAAVEIDTCLVLSDCTLVSGGHSSADLYFLAQAVRTMPLSTRLREAVVMPLAPEAQRQVRFWETTASNRGLAVRIFQDRASALQWLLSSDTAAS